MALDFIIPALPGLADGMLLTLKLLVMAVGGGVVLGTLLALRACRTTCCCRGWPSGTSITSVPSRCCWSFPGSTWWCPWCSAGLPAI
jgi:ABC-type amino acid transport system permease subunit